MNLEEYDDVKIIGDYAFKDNKMIRKIFLPKKLKEIGNHAFQACEKLEGVKFYNEIKKLGLNPFERCPNIEINFEDPLHSRFQIKDNYFLIDTKTETLISYLGKKENVILYHNSPIVRHIYIGAFYGCNHINRLNLYADSISVIDDETFFYSDIDTIILTDNVKSIGNNAFRETTKVGVTAKSFSKYRDLIFKDIHVFELTD